MTYIYSNPARENDTHALPNVEVFSVDKSQTAFMSCRDCGADEGNMPAHDYETNATAHEFVEWEPGWYWQACLPGCLPDGEPSGPFKTYDLAVADAQDNDDDEGDDNEL